MPVHRGLVVVAVALAAGLAASVFTPAAHAQWLPDHPYTIQRLGFFGPGYVGSTGYSHSTVFGVTPFGRICGTSQRVSGVSTVQGQAVWVYTPATGGSQQIGANTGSSPNPFQAVDFQTGAGQVVGRYLPLASGNVPLGAQTWVYTPGSQTSVLRTGLSSAGFFYVPDGLAPSEYAFSQNQLFNEAGWIAGASKRFEANGVESGVGVWVFNPVTRMTVRTGMFDSIHTLVGNYQTSEIRAMTPAGQVVGVSARRDNALVGQSVWVYLPSANETRQLGDASGFEGLIKDVDFQNDAGHLALRSFTPGSQTAAERQKTFAFDPLALLEHRTGLVGAGYSAGEADVFSANAFQNAAGHTTGISRKFASQVRLGQNAWFYNAVTYTSTAIGLTGPSYTGVAGLSGGEGGGMLMPAGYQHGEPRGIDSAGRTAGISARITGANTHNGQDAWLYNPATNTTVLIGLTGPGFDGSAGYQFSEVLQLGDGTGADGSEKIFGYSRRISGVNTEIGQNLWVYDAVSEQTEQTGLSGPPWRGSSGAQFTGLDYANAAGRIAGYTKRYTGVNVEQGQNTWVWAPGPGNQVQTGLTTAAHTSGAYQLSQNIAMDEAGRVVGFSQRLGATGMANGQNIWVYNPATGTTIQTGLTAAMHTGSGGYQFSEYAAHNAAGQVVGTSRRITGVSLFNGYQDVWYFDSATGVTHEMVGMPPDARAYAEPTVLTEDGTLFGRYTVYDVSGANGSLRAFAFRPDRGFADLGSLVGGGLAASGWSALQTPALASGVNQVVGLGLANVGTAQAPVAQPGGQSVFVMVPSSCPADLGQQGGLPGADGLLDNNDFIVFIDYFFTQNTLADLGQQGGIAGADTLFDNNDFIVFIDQFFAGC